MADMNGDVGDASSLLCVAGVARIAVQLGVYGTAVTLIPALSGLAPINLLHFPLS